MKIVKVPLTQKHLDIESRSFSGCPLATAIKEKLNCRKVYVGYTYVEIYKDEVNSFRVDMSDDVIRLRLELDERLAVSPTEFDICVPDFA